MKTFEQIVILIAHYRGARVQRSPNGHGDWSDVPHGERFNFVGAFYRIHPSDEDRYTWVEEIVWHLARGDRPATWMVMRVDEHPVEIAIVSDEPYVMSSDQSHYEDPALDPQVEFDELKPPSWKQRLGEAIFVCSVWMVVLAMGPVVLCLWWWLTGWFQ